MVKTLLKLIIPAMSEKYDIPVALKPAKSGKKKKSKYANYIEEKDSFYNQISPKTKKLIAYVLFFTVFSYVFLAALRSGRHPHGTDFEIDIENGMHMSPDREKYMLNDARKFYENGKKQKEDVDVDADADADADAVVDDLIEDDAAIDDIDTLDAEEGELHPDKDTVERKSVKKTDSSKSGSKAKDNFEEELSEMMKKPEKGRKGGKKPAAKGKKDKLDDELSSEMGIKGSKTKGKGKLKKENSKN